MRKARILFAAAAMASGAFAAAVFTACSGDDSAASGGVDGAADGSPIDAAVPDGPKGPRGHCGPVQGPACDLVLQDCPSGQECKIQESDGGPDAAPTTACVAAASGGLGAGAACCPDQKNACAAGLECVGSAACSGGAPTGRCTPHCCPGDDAVCGKVASEDRVGFCERLVSQSNGTPLFYSCAYEPTCEPFRIKACPANEVCLIDTADMTTYGCHASPNPPGKGAGEACTYGNECADGLGCLGTSGARTCKYFCYKQGQGTPPFDASAVGTAPGNGGCPGGQACTGSVAGYPAYLGYCP